MSVPKSIISAKAVDLNTSDQYILSVRNTNRCHFFDRFPAGPYEVQLRLDWAELDANGDPKLDADVYLPGKTKPVSGSTRFPAHHTPKKKDSSRNLYTYRFKFENVDLLLQIQFTRRQQITGRARIVAAPQDATIHPELDEWLGSKSS